MHCLAFYYPKILTKCRFNIDKTAIIFNIMQIIIYSWQYGWIYSTVFWNFTCKPHTGNVKESMQEWCNAYRAHYTLRSKMRLPKRRKTALIFSMTHKPSLLLSSLYKSIYGFEKLSSSKRRYCGLCHHCLKLFTFFHVLNFL